MSSLLYNTINGVRLLKWSKKGALCHLIRGIARELKIKLPESFDSYEYKIKCDSILSFLEKDKNQFNFNGIFLPDISNNKEMLMNLYAVFEDVLLIPVYYNDNYSKNFVQIIDKVMVEGPYGYVDSSFDISVKAGDIVIDAGAWIGDFSAYAASKAAICYAFEPTTETYSWLCKTKDLNSEKGEIIPVKFGLGDRIEENKINTSLCSGSNSLLPTEGEDIQSELVQIVTLDSFVESNNIQQVNFLKADIEGYERNLLLGAKQTLKKYAPKLAICTYHLPDDPVVLESIIRDANPDYKVIHLRHKLFASV